MGKEKQFVTRVVPEKNIMNEKMPVFCKDPKALESMELHYEQKCEIDPSSGEEKKCTVIKTFVTVGKGASQHTYEFDRRLTLNQAKQIFLQRCDCGACRDYDIDY